jgi:hypothetical protein
MALTDTVRSDAAAPPAPAPSWSTPREAVRLWFATSTLRKTLRIAAVVGTILSLINQLGVILDGHATYVTWIRVGANYFVPFCVSSTGFLSATRRKSV